MKGQQDEHGRNRQASWYFFRIDGAAGSRDHPHPDRLRGRVQRHGRAPARWGPTSCRSPARTANTGLRSPTSAGTIAPRRPRSGSGPRRDAVWIAHQPPYTPRRLARLLEQVDRCEDARIEVIGKTAMGRDLHLVTVTAADVDDRDKATVWLQARQHAWESGTSFVMEGALRFITSDDPKARALRRRAVFLFTPMVDPDGCASGQVRFNANGFDVNRHWDEVDLRGREYLARMPEIWYVKKAIVAHVDSGRPIHLMINLHNTETDEYLATMAGDAASRAIVDRAERSARAGDDLPAAPRAGLRRASRWVGQRAPSGEGDPHPPDGAAHRQGPANRPRSRPSRTACASANSSSRSWRRRRSLDSPPHPTPLPVGARASAFSLRHAFAAWRSRPPSPSPHRGEGARRADEGFRSHHLNSTAEAQPRRAASAWR